MSKIVDTELGRFRLVTDSKKEWFLFECPYCLEWLPLNEEILAGRLPIDHESKSTPATYCSFSGTREFGSQLVSAMQAQILMGYKPYHDEGQDQLALEGKR